VERDIESSQELIEIMHMNSTNMKAFIAIGEVYKVDRSSALYKFKKLYQVDNVSNISNREYIEINQFETSM